ncbi:hypothetical protein LbFV_ORF105 [Leptopilina boulardi filamentous virus]|uniref:RING-type domain-containing protein n=1 Tax=Leptopilina boulardi filamentous virus TaxID=552509 RepID=A0A1S5YDG2_9VIRU|nr:hypothetical protein LbFV_ORF105 [Leptopilina boulardi filamentous virus]AQQ80025.1 hypothetical protein LbFV_ORF105 [Leptopilina boulardi filamentous virus]
MGNGIKTPSLNVSSNDFTYKRKNKKNISLNLLNEILLNSLNIHENRKKDLCFVKKKYLINFTDEENYINSQIYHIILMKKLLSYIYIEDGVVNFNFKPTNIDCNNFESNLVKLSESAWCFRDDNDIICNICKLKFLSINFVRFNNCKHTCCQGCFYNIIVTSKKFRINCHICREFIESISIISNNNNDNNDKSTSDIDINELKTITLCITSEKSKSEILSFMKNKCFNLNEHCKYFLHYFFFFDIFLK